MTDLIHQLLNSIQHSANPAPFYIGGAVFAIAFIMFMRALLNTLMTVAILAAIGLGVMYFVNGGSLDLAALTKNFTNAASSLSSAATGSSTTTGTTDSSSSSADGDSSTTESASSSSEVSNDTVFKKPSHSSSPDTVSDIVSNNNTGTDTISTMINNIIKTVQGYLPKQ